MPIKRGHPRGVERLQVLMQTICLRRTKSDEVENSFFFFIFERGGSPLRKFYLEIELFSLGFNSLIDRYFKLCHLIRINASLKSLRLILAFKRRNLFNRIALWPF